MVGLVLVSHSETLARGVLELIEQVAPGVPVAAAAGVDDPEHPIGTDACRIVKAVGDVRGPEGALLLVDLGSAVLSAEVALELLGEAAPADAGAGPVALCAAALVEGAVAAASRAAAGGSLEEVRREAEAALEAKRHHAAAAGEPIAAVTPPTASRRARVANPLGLHARPAARLVRAAGGFDAAVTVTNTTRGRGPASALSLSRLAALELRQGDEMEIAASGRQADDAVAAIAAMAEEGFGETAEAAPARPQEQAPAAVERPQARFAGTAGSGGLAIGPAVVAGSRGPRRSGTSGADPRQELARLTAALAAVSRRLERAADRLEPQVGRERADMLRAESVMLADPDLIEATRRAMLEKAMPAEAAWEGALEAVIESYRRLEDPYLRDRLWDVVDLRAQVLDELAGGARPPEAAGAVLVVPELLLSGLADLQRARPLAVVAAGGGVTSHAAIFARALPVPFVIGVGDAVLQLPQGTLLAVDGSACDVRVVPPRERAAWESARRGREALAAALLSRAHEPAVTSDGVRVAVTANIASMEDAERAVRLHADGVGVFRTELLFAAPSGPPGEDEQARIYGAVASRFAGRPVVVRTLDVGGDKPIGGMAARGEANPFLGVRGCRLYARMPGVFRAQVRAVLRAASGGRVELLFPMVSTEAEARDLRAAVEEERAALRAETVRVGLMIEVPSAAIAADRLAPHADFFSIGTNDLAQYLFAADRTNPDVAPLADALHPALLRAIAAATRAGRAARVPSTVCGEMAARPEAVPLLVGLGIVELSVAPASLPLVKEAVRRTDAALAARVAEEALALAGAREVRALVRARFPSLGDLEPRVPAE